MAAPDLSRLVTAKEAAAALGVSRRQVTRRLRRGTIPGGLQVGRTWYLQRPQFESFLSDWQRRQAPSGPPASGDGDAAAVKALTAALEAEVAERRRVEEALLAERQRFARVMDTLPAYLVLMTPDHHVPFANRYFRERFGESEGRRCFEYLFGRSEPCEVCESYKALSTGEPIEWEWTGPDGHDYEIHDFPLTNADGSAVIMEVGIDITERKRAGAALRQANETLEDRVMERTAELQTINAALEEEISERTRVETALAQERERLLVTLRSIGDGVIATDADGRVALMNPIAEAMTGWREGEALGRPLGEVFDIRREPSDDPAPDPVARVLQTGAVQGLANHTVLVSRDGTRRLLADSAAPIIGHGNTIAGVVLVFQDVTETARLEQELAKMNKLESLGILAGGIAHDFNNLLTGILGNIILARLDTADRPPVGEALLEAETAATQAKSLTQQLLTFARGGEPVRRPLALPELLREATAFSLRGSRCTSRFVLAPDLWSVKADAGQIGQVIHNLVLNAGEAMPLGGVVTISAENLPVTAEDALPLVPGNYVRVTVADRGCGIEPQILHRVFDPYFSTKPDGSGIGLAVVYSVAVKHDGYVTVESEPGKGTSFHVYLPSVDRPDRPQMDDRIGGDGATRVLVMDDEDTVLRVAKRMLERLGLEATTAKHGAETIELYTRARQQGRPYGAVILDLYVTGGIGGKETLSRLRQVDPSVRAIVCSGYSSDPVMAQYAYHGFCAALDKPFALDRLQEAVAAAVAP
ncbi:MAG: hybrid sensor histidine kinase/response regulator [Anaerolineae bacterium]